MSGSAGRVSRSTVHVFTASSKRTTETTAASTRGKRRTTAPTTTASAANLTVAKAPASTGSAAPSEPPSCTSSTTFSSASNPAATGAATHARDGRAASAQNAPYDARKRKSSQSDRRAAERPSGPHSARIRSTSSRCHASSKPTIPGPPSSHIRRSMTDSTASSVALSANRRPSAARRVTPYNRASATIAPNSSARYSSEKR
jgi:hypothetical protein